MCVCDAVTNHLFASSSSSFEEPHPVLLGYDVVQYHFIPSYKEGGVAVRGNPQFAYNFGGYQFWFSTQKNRDLFREDPWKYAPAWGGFCSYGVALELAPQWPWQTDFLGPPASPWDGWLIQDGVLIFNIWESYSDRFLEDGPTNMAKAKNRWSGFFHGDLHAGPFNTHCIGWGALQNWCLEPSQPAPWIHPLPPPPPGCNETNFQHEGDIPHYQMTMPSSTTTTTTTTHKTGCGGNHTVFVIAVVSTIVGALLLTWFWMKRQEKHKHRKITNTSTNTTCVDAKPIDDEATTTNSTDDDDDEVEQESKGVYS